MAKELPYFRLTCQEWDTGDISLESLATQGLFMQACNYYWSQNCDVLVEKIQKKFRKNKILFSKLLKEKIIKIDGGRVRINFLDRQWTDLLSFREKKRISGSKGGKQKASNAKISLDQKPSYKEKEKENDKEKENIKYIVSFLNSTTSQKYKANTKKTQSLIASKLKAGFTVEDFKIVIEKKYDEWKGTKYEQYLRPVTLFGEKFEGYVNQKAVQSEGDRLSKIFKVDLT